MDNQITQLPKLDSDLFNKFLYFQERTSELFGKIIKLNKDNTWKTKKNEVIEEIKELFKEQECYNKQQLRKQKLNKLFNETK